ncbi:zinc-dependent metalloprotease [Nocardioides mesophilus]|uniref:Zinc-dependent metalloprotease n=2 Tax=Nocardioides mesophilus TaxID=433659 RepID=A0A7G9RHA9_9ACTN|nr:zinc-dependent metalloprotease [Nocardioides mesophilus]
MIDWDLAVSAASRMAGPGPNISRAEAEDAVAELRGGAGLSTPLVREFTGLVAQERTAPVLVVDRAGWIQANADGFAQVLSPLVDKLQQRKGAPSPMAEAVGSRVTGLEVGALLGFMSSKVLGQFDPFYGLDDADPAAPAGRLLLVAPNIVHAENEMDVDRRDFRLWVCLHEETHRVQFTAVPWMRDHINAQIDGLVGGVEVDPARLASMVGEGARRIGDVLRGDEEVSLLELFSSPQQREVLDRITAVMSLLEGHADVVMDGVGPEVIPSVAAIRRRFNERRKGAGPLDRVLRRLLGLEAKMAQYRNGAAFVRGAVDKVGMEGFNAVWVGPENLPSRDEIGDPEAWVRRVHG